MKSNEIMIGDWVHHYMAEYCQEDVQISREDMYDLCSEPDGEDDRLRPIPLTEEILEKNGIPTNGDPFIFKEDKDCCLELTYENGELLWTINIAEYAIISFIYVHEFQHALRLCGLNELADKFKVK